MRFPFSHEAVVTRGLDPALDVRDDLLDIVIVECSAETTKINRACCRSEHPFDSRRVQDIWWPQPLRCLVIGENPGDSDSPYFYDPRPTDRIDPVEVRRYLLDALATQGLITAPTLEAFRADGFAFDHAIRCTLPSDVVKQERQLAGKCASKRAHRATHLRDLISAAPKVWIMGRLALDAVRHVCGLTSVVQSCRVRPHYELRVDCQRKFFVSRYLNRWAEKERDSISSSFKAFLLNEPPRS